MSNITTTDKMYDRFTRLMVFIILVTLLNRYCLGIELSDGDQIKLILASGICFMVVDTYYPRVLVKSN